MSSLNTNSYSYVSGVKYGGQDGPFWPPVDFEVVVELEEVFVDEFVFEFVLELEPEF